MINKAGLDKIHNHHVDCVIREKHSNSIQVEPIKDVNQPKAARDAL